jgi:hypothetical protein
MVTRKKKPEALARRRNRKQEFLLEFLKGKKCVDCTEANILVLEFDHREVDSKLDAVTKMINNRVGSKKILEEIAKCDIVCSNCHTIRTMRRGNHWRHRMAIDKGLIKE